MIGFANVNDLMMAVIVAAPTLAGLIAIVLGQSKDRKLFMKTMKLTYSFMVIAVILAICWFVFNQPTIQLWAAGLSVIFLMLEIWAFYLGIDRFLRQEK